MLALDFSESTELCFEWIKKVLKPKDFVLLANVLNLKPASILILLL